MSANVPASGIANVAESGSDWVWVARIARVANFLLRQVGGGTWTPTDASGAGLTFTSVSANWSKIGNCIHAYGTVSYPATADASQAKIGGLPFASANFVSAQTPSIVSTTVGTAVVLALVIQNTTTAFLFNAAGGANITNANLSTGTIRFCFIYPAISTR